MQQTLEQMACTFYRDEVDDHLTYTVLAEQTADPSLRQQIGHIAAMERRHADFWQGWLTTHRVPLPPARMHRGRLAVLRLARRLVNPLMLVGLLEFRETASLKRYQHFLAQAPLEARDRTRLQAIVVDELEHETYFKHATQTLGVAHVRDFVLGMNDGLVEVLGTVAGLSAVYPQRPLLVAVSGLIVGLAGALSMGLGAFSSVRSQRQVHNGSRERMELLFTMAPERAIRAYHTELMDSGLPEPLATEVAQKLGTNKEALLQMVLQTSQDNEVRSGLLTGGAYLLGMLFPILPYFCVASSLLALPLAIASAGSTLILMACVVALFSGLSIRQKIGEMVVAGFVAAGLSYAFGTLLQTVFGLQGGHE